MDKPDSRGVQAKKILLVEDEGVTAMALKSNLIQLGYEVPEIVSSGEDAIRAAAEIHPDLILMDIKLDSPMSGIEAADEIRKAYAIPIVYITAYTDAETIGKAKTTEPFGYLPKPCSIDTLMSTIEVALYKGEVDAQRRKAEETLKEREELIRKILEIVDESFIVIDRDFRILTANRAYSVMVKMPLEDIIGRHCYKVSHQASTPCAGIGYDCAVKRTFETEKSHASTHVHQDSKGVSIHVETKAYPLTKDGSGEVVTVIETIVDITEKLKLEEQLRQAQKMEGIGQLAGGIAHDFNNILTAIISYGNIALMKMAKDDPQRLNIEHMLEAANRAAQLTKDLLLFSRKQVSERKPVDLNEIIKTVEKFLKRVIGEDVEYRTMLFEEAMPVLGDSHQLEQVMMNLAMNGRDAMPTGGILTITTDQVKFDEEFISSHGYGKPGQYALTTVSDTGKGMDEVTRQHIFEPFFTTKEVGKGTGLGLAVVYGIIKQHEGFINVYSEPGQGTTFRIYLPLIASVMDEEKKVVQELTARGTETILFAEDEETVREVTRFVLEDFGYTVITAHDGQDAVNRYKENRDKIHLLLFDIVMPKKTGKMAYDEIRAIRPDIKVIFQSGYAPDIVRNKVSLGDNANIVYKPISPMELLKKVRGVLDAK